MRAIDLLGTSVFDVDGRPVGTVRDLRLERRVGSPAGDRPVYLLTALECGPVGLAHRLGYARRDMSGPWPLTALLRRLSQRSRIVAWSDVTVIAGSRIEIGRRRDELDRPSSERP